MVIGELKLSFNLELVLQGVDRAAACDEVWLAARRRRARARERPARPQFVPPARIWNARRSRARRVQMLVEPRRGGRARPAPPLAPRRRTSPPPGRPRRAGAAEAPIMTAYRQRALACAAAMAGPRARATSGPPFPTPPKSCCTTSTAGSPASSAEPMADRRRPRRAGPLAARAAQPLGQPADVDRR